MRRIVRGLAPIIACAAPLVAQDVVTVAGRTLDEAGAPVSGATIRLEDGTAPATTDADGRFTITARDCRATRITARGDGRIAETRALAPCGREPLVLTLASRRTRPETMGPATGPAFVSGLVTDVSGAPIADAEVRLVGSGLVTKSNAVGRYSFAGLRPGPYLLRVRAPGKVMASVGVRLAAGDARDFPTTLRATETWMPRDSIKKLVGDDGTERMAAEFEARSGPRGNGLVVAISREELMAADDGRDLAGCTVARIPLVQRLVPELTPGTCLDYNPCLLLNGKRRFSVSFAQMPLRDLEFVEISRTPGEQYNAALGDVAPACDVKVTAAVWLRTP